jgi:heme/copper-type cytochrome/quinol oxidase subunit 3
VSSQRPSAETVRSARSPLAVPPRGGGAVRGRAVSALAAERRSQPSGIWGIALFLSAEAMLFAGLIASYFYLDFRATRWPPAGVKPPEVLDPALLTGVLVVTSLPVAFAARSARGGELRGTLRWLALATFVQSGYLAFQLHDFVAQLHVLPPQSGAYASAYYALLGLHHGHVLLGLLLDLGMLFWLARSGLSDYRATGVRAVALYWHVVNVIAVAVLFTEIVPAL